MASKIELYDLVKSLDSKEKRYLKMLMKALSGAKQKKYRNHFDSIVSMKKYDDLIWKRKMGFNATTKQIKETNNYLYDFILKGLVIYTNATDKSKNRILVEAQKLNMLVRKGLYQTASKKVDELIQLCLDQQYFDLSLHLINEKRSIHFGTGKLNNEDFAYSIYDEFQASVEQCDNVNEYLRLLQKMKFAVINYTSVRSKEIEDAYTDLNNHPLMKDSSTAINLRSKNLFFVMKLAVMYFQFNEKEALKISDESLVFFGDEKSEIYNELYLGFMLNKRMEITGLFGNWVEFEKALQKFISRKPFLKSHSQNIYWFIHEIRHRLTLQYAKVELAEFKSFVAEIDAEEYKNAEQSYPTVYFEIEFRMAKFYQLNSQYDIAIEKLNNIITNSKKISRELTIAAKILLLIIHFELQNNIYLPYAIQSLYRTLLKTETIFLAERKLIHFLKKAITLNDRNDIIELSKKLFNEWNALKKDKHQRDFFFYFPYCEWILSKILDKPLVDILEEYPHPNYKVIEINF